MGPSGVMGSISKIIAGDEDVDSVAEKLELDDGCTAVLRTAVEVRRKKMLVRVVMYICALKQMQTFHLRQMFYNRRTFRR